MPALPGVPLAAGRTAEIFAWQDGAILKLYRDWAPRQWVDHELRITRIVYAAGLAVPAPGDAVEINGRVGLVYERIDGASMLDAMTQRLFLTMRQMAQQMAELHVAMHDCTVPDLPLFKDRLEHDIRSADWLPDDVRTVVLQRLDDLPGGDCLCHGDFHPGNVLMSGRGPVVIDWMTASRGQPLADLARTLLLLRAGPPLNRLARVAFDALSSRFAAEYLKRYSGLRPVDRGLLAAWQPIIAAARMNEKIEGEREGLLEIVRRGLGLWWLQARILLVATNTLCRCSGIMSV